MSVGLEGHHFPADKRGGARELPPLAVSVLGLFLFRNLSVLLPTSLLLVRLRDRRSADLRGVHESTRLWSLKARLQERVAERIRQFGPQEHWPALGRVIHGRDSRTVATSAHHFPFVRKESAGA